jgi:hypothetical protein
VRAQVCVDGGAVVANGQLEKATGLGRLINHDIVEATWRLNRDRNKPGEFTRIVLPRTAASISE